MKNVLQEWMDVRRLSIFSRVQTIAGLLVKKLEGIRATVAGAAVRESMFRAPRSKTTEYGHDTHTLRALRAGPPQLGLVVDGNTPLECLTQTMSFSLPAGDPVLGHQREQGRASKQSSIKFSHFC